uniref:Uncharacterized protein n=1 Tax=Physcomitrium patens TaxID=3218 RepID=A0A2K1JRS4_PHYPA|nr:hypothetical protein PHYPA_016617 [Physcomitrium patens]
MIVSLAGLIIKGGNIVTSGLTSARYREVACLNTNVEKLELTAPGCEFLTAQLVVRFV